MVEEISTKAPEGNGGKAGKGGKGGKGKAKGGKPSAAAAARASDVCGMERRQSVTAKAPVTPAPAAAESGGGRRARSLACITLHHVYASQAPRNPFSSSCSAELRRGLGHAGWKFPKCASPGESS